MHVTYSVSFVYCGLRNLSTYVRIMCCHESSVAGKKRCKCFIKAAVCPVKCKSCVGASEVLAKSSGLKVSLVITEVSWFHNDICDIFDNSFLRKLP